MRGLKRASQGCLRPTANGPSLKRTVQVFLRPARPWLGAHVQPVGIQCREEGSRGRVEGLNASCSKTDKGRGREGPCEKVCNAKTKRGRKRQDDTKDESCGFDTYRICRHRRRLLLEHGGTMSKGIGMPRHDLGIQFLVGSTIPASAALGGCDFRGGVRGVS